MKVISSEPFEAWAGEWKTVPAGTYELDTHVRAHSEEVAWLPGRTVIIDATETKYADNYLSLPWFLIFAFFLACFGAGFRFRF